MHVLDVTLAAREELAAGYCVLHFDLPAAVPSLEARAGQFAMLRATGWGDAPLLPRPMSILQSGKRPSILIKVVGEGTRRMSQDPLGHSYRMLAPLGRPWEPPASNEDVILVAGGVGVAPLLYLAQELAAKGAGRIRCIYGGRSERDLPLVEELAELSELSVTTEDGSRGMRGRVTDRLAQMLVGELEQCRIYTCGPHAMMAAVAAMAAEAKVRCDASLEAPMGCGYGVCLGCPVARKDGSYLYTCVDGPCVDASGIDWSRGVF
jgi:dihydroorotate dehydrogenase electron transfer subunit